ncbi:putative endoplasmic reticulum mannosyl-oligosaccharide 1,2-alpha-mannosidase [Mollisia scopiformis]|uniref:alpha-1,2-Mannosidase n=1 Tax=Mollisia scopiformis TaxID=149040 RepID=A0A194XBN9_MOLSC|nr:putative endoplasmic reticulum mannosyl-oligosaccharide 1,2-alpha-mannosidase [Mollisia scopiformis]KUJ17573.1 putative endoplasmic reticulum mannosyl-oligosaccharide 1,2-alpha-mannosidase [Mollisia scopiformis]
MTSPFPRATTRRLTRGLVLTVIVLVVVFFVRESGLGEPKFEFNYVPIPIRPERYPLQEKTIRLPQQSPRKIPKIQRAPVVESVGDKKLREGRLQEVKDEFLHAWRGYKQDAWGHDELMPIAGGYKSPFCGWAATMVDALDTLWIMGLKDEFELSLVELRNIDFTNTQGCQVNLFETTIRHLGGLLSAFDISGGKYTILVQKAVELAEILFTAFDTPNRMPTPHYEWSATNEYANTHLPSGSIVLAVLGSLSLEFTRLSQITGNDKYYDAIQRVMDELEKWQDKTALPGMWPSMVDATKFNESCLLGTPWAGMDEQFTLGALADSTYEYLPKQFMLLGGTMRSYRTMYEKFVEVAKKYLFFRPMTVTEEDILISGAVSVQGDNLPRRTAELQHLTCFSGGMLAIAGKVFNRPADVDDGAKLADGCVWAYKNTVTGIMPETLTAVACENKTSCKWDTKKWYNAIDRYAEEEIIRERIMTNKLSPGFASVQDARYLLRPEAIESVFILYRITGDTYWADSGWTMFKSIMAHTKTKLAHSAIQDVLSAAPPQVNEMESFWLAETLKYFYLLYSTFDVVSLDEYVLNTEAHPLRRPR